MFSAHLLAGVCGRAPDEIVGTKSGGEGTLVILAVIAIVGRIPGRSEWSLD